MVNIPDIEPVLNKICDLGYINSEIDLTLLKYLIDSTLLGKSIKEIDIARDVFDKEEDFSPLENSLVRTHMYMLRKKIEAYDAAEGEKDPISIKLPKGQYLVKFIENKNQARGLDIKNLIIAGLIVVLLSFIFYFTINHKSSEIKSHYSDSVIWSDFLASDLQTLVVLGNYYFFEDITAGIDDKLLIRNTKINSEEELAAYLEINPQQKENIREAKITYLGVETPPVFRKILEIFKGYDDKIRLILSSDLNWHDIQENNIIFIGSIKTLRKLDFYFNFLGFKYSLFPHYVYYIQNNDTLDTIKLQKGRNDFFDDYTIVVKIPGNHNNTVMIITSFSSFGQVESLSKLASLSAEEKIKSKQGLKKIPRFFESLFRVTGVKRSGFKTELMQLFEIDPTEFMKSQDFKLTRETE